LQDTEIAAKSHWWWKITVNYSRALSSMYIISQWAAVTTRPKICHTLLAAPQFFCKLILTLFKQYQPFTSTSLFLVPRNNKINGLWHEIIRFTWVWSLTWCPWRSAWPDARGKWRRCQQWEGIHIWTVQWISVLKVPSGQIGSAWEWYHWIGLEKDINRYRFLIYYFLSWIFDKSSKFLAASCKKESNLLLEQHCGGLFHRIKVRQPIGRQDSMQTMLPNKQVVGFIFAWRGSELWSFFKYSRVKLKNQKNGDGCL
jgi:hypothetical protein